MNAVVIVLGLADIFGNEGQGEIIKPLDGSIKRFTDGVGALTVSTSNFLVICTAGYDATSPREPVKNARKVSLAHQFERWVLIEMPDFQDFLRITPLCWSTRKEVKLGIRLAMRESGFGPDDDVELVIASNPLHLLRIWLCTKWYAPKKWRVRLIPSFHAFSLASWLREIPAFFYYLDHFEEARARLRGLKAYKLVKALQDAAAARRDSPPPI